MNKPVLLTLTFLTSAALALPLAAQAQQPAAGAASAQQSAAKKPARKTKKGVPYKTAKAVEANTPAQTPSDRLSQAELETAQHIYTGIFPCELGEHVTVTADAAHPGFFNITSGKRRYDMHPVESRTGAIRMEDNRRGAVWLQLGSKSMLMDQKTGQRVADDCKAAAQQDYAARMQNYQQHRLFDLSANGQPLQQPTGPVSLPVRSGELGVAPVGGGQPSQGAASAPAAPAQPTAPAQPAASVQPADQDASAPADLAQPAGQAASGPADAAQPPEQAASAPDSQGLPFEPSFGG